MQTDRSVEHHDRADAPTVPSTQRTHTIVFGMFLAVDHARDAMDALQRAGFDARDVSVVTPHREQPHTIAEETGAHPAATAATGLVAGGVLGGLAGWLIGAAALAIPGIGPVIAAGAIATAIAGATMGAGVGVLAGALIGLGVPEHEAQWYEGEVQGGRTLVLVLADTHHREARELLRQYGAYDVRDQPTEAVSQPLAADDTAPLHPTS